MPLTLSTLHVSGRDFSHSWKSSRFREAGLNSSLVGLGITRFRYVNPIEGHCRVSSLCCVFFTLDPSLQERDGFGGLLGRSRGRNDSNMGGPGTVQEVTYTVPGDKCGLVIGKGE